MSGAYARGNGLYRNACQASSLPATPLAHLELIAKLQFRELAIALVRLRAFRARMKMCCDRPDGTQWLSGLDDLFARGFQLLETLFADDLDFLLCDYRQVRLGDGHIGLAIAASDLPYCEP